MTVISDTSPLNYLLLLGETHLLPVLYGRILIPPAVLEELRRPSAPALVREWAAAPPGWLVVLAPQRSTDPRLAELDEGEREALALALELHADLVLIDERDGREAAGACGLRIAGTLRVLTQGALLGLTSLPDAFRRLQATRFRVSQELLDTLLAEVDEESSA